MTISEDTSVMRLTAPSATTLPPTSFQRPESAPGRVSGLSTVDKYTSLGPLIQRHAGCATPSWDQRTWHTTHAKRIRTDQWQAVVPLSVYVPPATGTNCQS